jgi:hypothetical protein
MPQFQTPQFIEREAKVIGPLTFKAAGYVGTPLVIIFILYFAIAAKYFMLFIALSLLLEGAGIALAFAKVESKSIPQIMTNALFFFTKPRTYVWKRGNTKLHFKEEKYTNQRTNGEGLQKADLVRTSRVANLAVRVQTKK